MSVTDLMRKDIMIDRIPVYADIGVTHNKPACAALVTKCQILISGQRLVRIGS